MSVDRNKDGKILKAEIPKGLQERILTKLDLNKDDVIDKAELAAFAKQEAQRKKKEKQ